MILYVKSPPINLFLRLLSCILNNKSKAGIIKYEPPDAPICAKPPNPPKPTPPNPPKPAENGSTMVSVISDLVNHNNSFISRPAGISYICVPPVNDIKSFLSSLLPPACKPTILEYE